MGGNKMDLSIDKNDWDNFIKKFNKRNLERPTKLQICDESGVATEVKFLPFLGIDLEEKGENSPRLNILLGDNSQDGRHFSHSVDKISKLLLKEDKYGQDEVLNIENENSEHTFLTFESLIQLD